MSTLTITEALAEIKTIDARIAKKQEFIGQHLCRQDGLRDPLEKQGGSVSMIKQEMQSIADLQERKVTIRRAIQSANGATLLTIDGITRPIADWLVWRREVAPSMRTMLANISTAIQRNRAEALKRGFAVVSATDRAPTPNDLLVNMDELKLANDIEGLEGLLGKLDGQLSLKNATITVDI